MIGDVSARVDKLETRGAATTAPSKKTSGGVKCTKCHARGHAAIDCKSKNPAAVRRRIASNNRRKKEAKSGNFVLPPLYQTMPYGPQQIPPTYSPHANSALIVAESLELRRRAQQSQRDKCRARANAAAAALTNTPAGRR